MLVVEVNGSGDSAALTSVQASDPRIRPDEVLVDVAAAGVNRADLLQRAGRYPPPPGASDILGLEVSGIVSALGDDVVGWRVGDRVAALLSGGGYAERAAVPAAQLLPVPDGIDLVDAAALPEAVCTVWSTVVDAARMQRGEHVLVHGASGGVGSVAVQLLTALGGRVVATARDEDRLARCRTLGAVDGFTYRRPDGAELVDVLPDLVRGATEGRGADVILDVVGAAYLDAHLRSLAVGGRLAVIGMQRGSRAELDLGQLLARRASIVGTTLRSRPAWDKARIVAAVRDEVWPMLDDGRLRPVVHARVPLTEADRAHSLLGSGEVFGKVLLVP